MSEPPVEGLRRSLEVTERLVARVSPGQWAAPTPCVEWDVRALVTHLVFGNRLFAAILRGESPPRAAGPQPRGAGPDGVDVLGDDAAGAFRASADELLAAFDRPGVLERVFTVPLGTVPGAMALHLRTVEALAHGWDLAQATGQSTSGFPDDVAEAEIAFSRESLPSVPSTRTPFGPPQPAPDDAPATDRLAALLGRPLPAVAPG